MDKIFHTSFLVLSACGLANMVIAPWVHAWQLRRLVARVNMLETTVKANQTDDDDPDPPDDGKPIVDEINVVAFAKKAA